MPDLPPSEMLPATLHAEASREFPQAISVHPSNTEDVRQLIRWASERKRPLVPISSAAGARRRGDSNPSQGAIVCDLSRMKTVPHVDGKTRIAVVEPGVTYDELDTALRPHGLRSYRPFLPRKGKSVLGACLEREATLCPYEHWDAPDPIGAMEIVFGNGDVYRTGGASLKDSREELWARGNRFMAGMGPGATDFGRVILGAQGAFGIVTWAVMHTEWIPAIERAFFIPSDDLQSLCQFVAKWCWRRLQGAMFILSAKQLEALTGVSGTTEWVAFGNLGVPDFRPEARLAYEWDYVVKDASRLALSPTDHFGGITATAFKEKLYGPASECWKTQAFGTYEEIIVTCQLDQAPTLASIIDEESLVGIYLQPQVQGVTAHMEFTLQRPPQADQTEWNVHLKNLAGRLVDAGAFIARPYGNWGQVAFERDANSAWLLETARNLFDPHGVLGSGRLCFAAR